MSQKLRGWIYCGRLSSDRVLDGWTGIRRNPDSRRITVLKGALMLSTGDERELNEEKAREVG